MLVSESNLFRQRGIDIELNISSMDGTMFLIKVRNESMVDQLKVLVASQICGSDCEHVKEAVYYKLLHVQSSRMLEDDKTLRQQGVGNNDELLLVRRRIPQLLLHTKEESKAKAGGDVVNKEHIKEATKDLSSVNAEREDSDVNPHVDFLSELRKIVISLIDAAQKILCLNPEAAKIFDEAEKYMADQKTPPCTVDEAALQQLKDMGFAEARAKKALLINRMAAPDAIQWLLEHDSDPDIDTPLPGMEEITQEVALPGAVGGLTNGDVDSETQEFSKISGPKKIIRMLESFRAYRRKEFKPNPQVLRSLMEMGFQERDVVDALRIHNNRENEACDWLLSGEDRKMLDTNLDEGLDPDSEVYKAIMSNSVVQLGLSNPKSLTALLHMLENPSSTHQWLNDPDTGPMIIQISRIYHADKYGKKNRQKTVK